MATVPSGPRLGHAEQWSHSDGTGILQVLIMSCHDMWNTWHQGLWSPQNLMAKPEGFFGNWRPEGHVLHTSQQAMIKIFYNTFITQNYDKKCIKFTQIKLTTMAIDNSHRRQKKIGLGCSQEVTAPLILFFKLLFHWLNFDWHSKRMTYIHNHHSLRHTIKNITW